MEGPAVKAVKSVIKPAFPPNRKPIPISRQSEGTFTMRYSVCKMSLIAMASPLKGSIPMLAEIYKATPR